MTGNVRSATDWYPALQSLVLNGESGGGWGEVGVDDADSADQVLAALDELLSVARANIVAWIAVMERVEWIRGLRSAGMAYSDMPARDDSPRIIDAITTSQERLGVAAARFRRVMAHQLHAEGMSVADIARAFGVTRQRVSSLLKASDGAMLVDEPTVE